MNVENHKNENAKSFKTRHIHFKFGLKTKKRVKKKKTRGFQKLTKIFPKAFDFRSAI